MNGNINPPLDSERGTAQIITGNGGASLKGIDPEKDGNGYIVDSYIMEHGYTELAVSGDTLILRHILKDGTVFDELVYTANSKKISSNVDTENELRGVQDNIVLFQNYPNPFNSSTRIKYELPEEGRVELAVYYVNGQHIETLVDEYQQRGSYRVDWNLVGPKGDRLPSGLYVFRLKSFDSVQTRKMIVIQ